MIQKCYLFYFQFQVLYTAACVYSIYVLFMMTSSNGNIFRVTGPLCGEFTGPGEFPAQRPVTRSFDVFFDLRLNKRLSKQPWGWWFETPAWSLWRHRNVRYCTSWCIMVYLLRYKGVFHRNKLKHDVIHARILSVLGNTQYGPWEMSSVVHRDWETETGTSLFNTTWHYTDAWYQTYMTVIMYYSVLTWYQILACMLGDPC